MAKKKPPLKKCPFCETKLNPAKEIERVTFDSGGGWSEEEYAVTCPTCGGSGPKRPTKKLAIEAYTPIGGVDIL